MEAKTKKVKNKKTFKIKTNILRSIGNGMYSLLSHLLRRNGRQQWEGFAENDSFNPGMKEWWMMRWNRRERNIRMVTRRKRRRTRT